MANYIMLRPLWILRNFILKVLKYPCIGARVLVIKDDEVLLIRHTYEKGWFTIGGAVEEGETFLQAAVRELHEEVGITPTKEPELFGAYYNRYYNRDDYIALFTVKEFTIEPISSIEIAEMKWFKLDALPEGATPATKRRIEEYLGLKNKSDRW